MIDIANAAMSPTLDAFLRSWPFEPWLTAALLLLRGRLSARLVRAASSRPAPMAPAARLAAFLGGLVAIFLALASPIEPFASLLLQAHMVQHLLLMMVAPAADLAGRAAVSAAPRPAAAGPRLLVAPAAAGPAAAAFFGWLTHPFVALPLFVAAPGSGTRRGRL